MTVTNNPPKGTSDWFPDEFKVRQYIFDTWRKVCKSFGYEEYLTPIFERAEIYKAKSGEDIGGKELMTMTDKAGRELAIRPEMTPSVTRMVTRNYNSLAKPIRYFSIANYVRNEKPQRGRNREFWQLNADIFGSTSINSDIELLVLALEIMLAFNPREGSFVMNLNNRKLIDGVINQYVKISEEVRTDVIRVLDKYNKLTNDEFRSRLEKLGLNIDSISKLELFVQSTSADELIANIPELKENDGYIDTIRITETLSTLGYSKWINFNPSIIRGFDYYDGMVFEVFDNHPDNTRALFGGGRYNGLARLFVNQDIPATGFAPGDETLKLFLEAWNLLPNELFENNAIYIPLLFEESYEININIANKLRKLGNSVEVGFDLQDFGKAFSYADKKKYKKVIIIGEDEFNSASYILKDMISGEQKKYSEEELLRSI